MNFDEYSVLQNIIKESAYITDQAIKTAKTDLTGMSHRKYSKNRGLFFSTNDIILGKKTDVAQIYPPISDMLTSTLLERQTICLTAIKNKEELLSKLSDSISRLGRVKRFCIELSASDRVDIITPFLSNKIVNNYRWTTANILITLEENGEIWNIKRQAGIDNIVTDSAIMNVIHALVDDYSPYLSLPLVSINDCVCDLILPNGQGGILVHEAVGHALEADYFFENESVFSKKLFSKIANDQISVYDEKLPNKIMKSDSADDGSHLTDSVDLISNGFLTGILSDAETAKRWGINNTGNGRSESYKYPCIPRMRNTYMKNGIILPETIIESTKSGIYAIDIGGGQVDLQSGSFIFSIECGIGIKNGIPVYRTTPFLFKGNIRQTLNEIDLIGNDLAFHCAICGKKGQAVPILYGQPTVRIHNQHLGGIRC